MRKAKFGEIYYFDFGKHEGSIQNGRRPALVVQDNILNEHSTTTLIAAITSVTKKTHLPSHVVLNKKFGLSKKSMVLLEQVVCVNQSDLQDYIGMVDEKTKKRIVCRGLKKTFGNLESPANKTATLKCLCPKCLQYYIHSNRYIVKRLDPFSTHKEKCDRCDSFGYEYILVQRRRNADNSTCNPENRTFEEVSQND